MPDHQKTNSKDPKKAKGERAGRIGAEEKPHSAVNSLTSLPPHIFNLPAAPPEIYSTLMANTQSDKQRTELAIYLQQNWGNSYTQEVIQHLQGTASPGESHEPGARLDNSLDKPTGHKGHSDKEVETIEQNIGTVPGNFAQLSADTITRQTTPMSPADEGALITQSLGAARPLLSTERVSAQYIFGDSLNLDEITVHTSSLFAVGALARVIGNSINFAESSFEMPVLMHELMHCWQYQHGYSLHDLLCGAIEGDYDYGYEEGLIEAREKQRQLQSFTIEEQAQMIEDYYSRWIAGENVDAWEQYIGCVRLGIPGLRPSTVEEMEESEIANRPSNEVPDLSASELRRMKDFLLVNNEQGAIDSIVMSADFRSIKMPRLNDERCASPPMVFSENLTVKEGEMSWRYDKDNDEANNIRAFIGVPACTSIPVLYSTLMHEYQHVCQVLDDPRSFLDERGLNEFNAYVWEIEHARETGLANPAQHDHLVDLGKRLLTEAWDMMSARQKEDNLDTFTQSLMTVESITGVPYGTLFRSR